MTQSRRFSAYEAAINAITGFSLSVMLQFFMAWWLNLPLSPSQNVAVVLAFTVLSFVRSYTLRRIFNAIG